MTRDKSAGYSLMELTFVLGVMSTLTAIAIPQILTTIDDSRALGAVRYMSTRLQEARMEAVSRTANVAVRFSADGTTYAYAVYTDGNGNGVLSRDIQRGVDPEIQVSERLSDQFPGVDFGVVPALPAVDSSSAPPGADPIRLGSSNMVSFSAVGSCTSGSLYIRGQRNAQYAIRILGETGRTRILKFDPRHQVWNSL